jgi:hypothetical protein
VDGVGSGRIRTVDSVSRVEARSGSGSGHDGRGSERFIDEPGARIPGWRMRFDPGSGHGGRGPDGRFEEAGARWIGRWMEDAESAFRMDAPGLRR